MEEAVKALKMGKSAGVDNIPADLVQAGGKTMIDILTLIEDRSMADHIRQVVEVSHRGE